MKKSLLLAILITFSFSSFSTIVPVTILTDGNSPGQLRYEINNASTGDTLFLDVASGAEFLIDQGVMNITKDMTILGNGMEEVSITTSNGSQLFNVDLSVSQFKIIGLKILNCQSSAPGGAIYCEGTNFNLDDVHFELCSSTSSGGAISLADNVSAVLMNCVFDLCTSDLNGGAINYGNANVSIDGTSFINCSALDGGAIYANIISSGGLSLYSSLFDGCVAQNTGGSISFNCSSPNLFTLIDCDVENSSATLGGGVYTEKANIDFQDNNFLLDSAYNGGAAFIGDSDGSVSLMAVDTCKASNNGGGFYLNAGGFPIVECNFNFNTALQGGGLYIENNSAPTSIENSTLQGNFAQSGGAIYFKDALATEISISTLSGNNATDGGAVYYSGTFSTDIKSSTLAHNEALNNGGAVHADAGVILSIENSVFGLNHAGATGHEILGPIINSTGNNFIGNIDGLSASWQSSDIVASIGETIYPFLTELANNGSSTPTHLPLSCSPLIGAGSVTATQDQNFLTRTSFDIGAAENQGAIASVYYTVENANAHGVGSFENGVINSCADTILFLAPVDGSVISLESSINIDRNLVVRGNGPSKTIFDGGASSGRFIGTDLGKVVVFDSMRIQNYDIVSIGKEGAAFANAGDLKLNYVDMVNCFSVLGGAIYTDQYSQLETNNCKFIGDSASTQGGAVYSEANHYYSFNTEYSNNSSQDGGAIFSSDSARLSIIEGVFNNNTAVSSGGAIYANSNKIIDSTIVYASSFTDNSSIISGGAVYFEGANYKFITESIFNSNSSLDGAAIDITNGGGHIESSIFRENVSGSSSGSLFAHDVNDTLKIDRSNFIGDTCITGIASISLQNNIYNYVRQNTIHGNVGAGIVEANSNIELINNTIYDNTSSLTPAFTMASAPSTFIISGNIIAGNTTSSGSTADANLNFFGSSGGYNLIGDGDLNGTFTWSGTDILGTLALPIDPVLSSLSFVGDMEVYYPECGSPALNTGNPASPATDQVGAPRVGLPDMGAAEQQTSISLPTADIAGNIYACTSGSVPDSLAVTINGNFPMSIEVSNGVESTTYNNLNPGVFYLHPETIGSYVILNVSDALCPLGTTNGTGNVTQDNLLVEVVTDVQPSCGNFDGAASVNAVGGIGPFTYEWTNGSTVTSATDLPAGYLTVLVEDFTTSCITAGSGFVNNMGGPSIQVDGIIDVLCNGENSGAINTTITGDGPLTILWENGMDVEDIMGLTAGIYSVQVNDVNGCISLDSVSVNEPDELEISFSVEAATCGGNDGAAYSTVTGGASTNYDYNWAPSGGTADNELGLGLGEYTLNAMDENGCIISKSVLVPELGSPTMNVDSVNAANCNLDNGAVFITLSDPSANVLWNSTSTSEDLVGVDGGSQLLEITEGSCTNLYYVDIPFVAPSATQICIATVDTVSQNNIITWAETPGNNISHYKVLRKRIMGIAYLEVGTVPVTDLSLFIDTVASSNALWWNYKIQTIDSCGIESALSETSNHRTIHLSIHQTGTVDEVELKWNKYRGFAFDKFYINRFTNTTGWEVIDSVANNVLNYVDNLPGDTIGLLYEIFVAAPNTCQATKANDFNSSRSNRTGSISGPKLVGLNESISLAFTSYPNPSTGLVNLVGANLAGADYTVTIISIEGRVVYQTEVKWTASSVSLDLTNLANGVYQISLENENIQSSQRLVIRK